MALEPEFEATFEGNSYGYRPGRSPIDAMKQIQLCLRQADKFVLETVSQNVLIRLTMKNF